MTESLYDKYSYIRKSIERVLKPERYRHSLSVALTASCLAMRYGVDVERAYLAGLLHDCAKYDQEHYLERAAEAGIEISETERESPGLLHSPLGAYLAKTKYNVDDEEICSAIRYHTIGRANMTMLEKIVYLADYIEPLRGPLNDIDLIRSTAFTDIDRAIYLTAKACSEVVIKAGKRPAKPSYETYEYYRKLAEGETNEF